MNPNWPLVAALLLILLKQILKLYIYNTPNALDHLKALSSLPLDISFLIVALFIRAAMKQEHAATYLLPLALTYVIFGIVSTVLWRVSDSALATKIEGKFGWAFPLNLAMSSLALFLALTYIG